ncbi:PD-(D/E)XK nuclease family protein, partial [Gemmatimonas sp.]|uniref:PD-(D/E)XK nuclease family protein n=1 Tax=Gemmatimonas sp. TaxID=1962908 RepID=UPI00356AFB40
MERSEPARTACERNKRHGWRGVCGHRFLQSCEAAGNHPWSSPRLVSASLRPLPDCVESVTVPRSFSVTALVAAGGCRLRAVLSSSSTSYRLPSGPEAAIGTFVHVVREKWACRSDHRLTAAQVFDAEYDIMRQRLRGDPDRAHFAELASTKSPSEWSMIRSQSVLPCTPLAPAAPSMGTSVGKGGIPKGLRIGSEIDLESATLRIRGRADRIDREGAHRWVVRDFKTGSALTPAGEPRPEYVLQMQFYGVMVLEADPSAQVRLLLDDGEQHEVPFDERTAAATRRNLQALAAAMPAPDAAVTAGELASPGPCCASCSHRIVCRAYRAKAPIWWRDYP